MQREQISVPGNNMARAAADPKFEKLVVLRIATCLDFRPHVHSFGFAAQCSNKSANIVVVDIPLESRPSQDFVEFGNDGK